MVKKVLFVCLGNICRSPMAEAIFLHLIEKNGVSDDWEVDSAGIGPFYVGKSPDFYVTEILAKNYIHYNGRARQIQNEDFKKYDYIFAMDEHDLNRLNRRVTGKAKILLLSDFDPKGVKNIIDPFYENAGKTEEYVKCYEQCMRCCIGFLKNKNI